MRSLRLVPVLLLCTWVGAAQQPNTPSASATWNAVDGPPWPIVTTLNGGSSGSITLTVSASIAGVPFAIARDLAGPHLPGIPTAAGLLDLDPTQLAVIADGIGSTSGSSLDAIAHVGPMGTWTFLAPIFPTTQFDLGAYQVLIADPLSPYGLTLTGATHLHVLPVPATAIYVSASSGAAGNPGTQAAPLQTISAGIAASQALFPRPPVFVMAGTYTETLVISNAISVHGGLDSGTWAFTGGRSIVNAGTTPVSVIVNQGPSVISGFDFRASPAAAPGAASIACRIEFANGQHFENCRFVAQSGGPGATGGAGATGGSGNAGSYGCPFGCESIWYQSALFGLGGQGARPGGAGGDGGIYANSALWNGQPGQAAPFGGGGGGPASAIQGFPPNNGASAPGAGQPGAPGGAGSHGQAGLPGGSVFSGVWSPGGGTSGAAGDLGLGGGGGGGSCTYAGLNGHCGGGGGAGGGGGGGGAGGGSGGASIAVQVFGGDPVFTECEFVANAGGNGGTGGNGGAGSAGGPGGMNPGSTVPHGANGGAGGAGGPGGGGGGGAGGPSWCVLVSGPAIPSFPTGCTFTQGTGGFGGAGGLRGDAASSAPSGPPGPTAIVASF